MVNHNVKGLHSVGYYVPLSEGLEFHITMGAAEWPFTVTWWLLCCMFKKLSQAAHLKTYERIHTDERPFSCSKCDKKFSHEFSSENHFYCYYI